MDSIYLFGTVLIAYLSIILTVILIDLKKSNKIILEKSHSLENKLDTINNSINKLINTLNDFVDIN